MSPAKGDATAPYQKIGHSNSAKNVLAGLAIGVLREEEAATLKAALATKAEGGCLIA